MGDPDPSWSEGGVEWMEAPSSQFHLSARCEAVGKKKSKKIGQNAILDTIGGGMCKEILPGCTAIANLSFLGCSQEPPIGFGGEGII